MSDPFYQAEQTYKELMVLWDKGARALASDMNLDGVAAIGYQRFKLLRAIGKGVRRGGDVIYCTKVDRTTASTMLRDMEMSGLVRRITDDVDRRVFGWVLTSLGEGVVCKLVEMYEGLLDEANDIIKENVIAGKRLRPRPQPASTPEPVQDEKPALAE
jgi:DNA-binding MarR family transcriptional regulator